MCPRTRKSLRFLPLEITFLFTISVPKKNSSWHLWTKQHWYGYIFLVVAVEQSEAANTWQLHLPDPMPGVVLRFPEIKGCYLLTKWVIIKKTKIKGTVLFKIVHPATNSVDQLWTEGSMIAWGFMIFFQKIKEWRLFGKQTLLLFSFNLLENLNSIIKHAICKVAESLIICLYFVVLLLLRLVKSDDIDYWVFAALLSFFFQSKMWVL